MYPDHFLQESDVADVHHVPERDQRYSLRRFPRRYRICMLLVLTLFGLHLLAAGLVSEEMITAMAQREQHTTINGHAEPAGRGRELTARGLLDAPPPSE